MPDSPGFKRCTMCRVAMLISDGHAQCVRCLGESHIPQKYVHCNKLKARARKDSDQRLKLTLMEKSLRPASNPGQESSSRQRSQVSSPPRSSKEKKLVKKWPASSPHREQTTAKWLLTKSLSSVPSALWLSTNNTPGTAGTNHEANGSKLPASTMTLSVMPKETVMTIAPIPSNDSATTIYFGTDSAHHATAPISTMLLGMDALGTIPFPAS